MAVTKYPYTFTYRGYGTKIRTELTYLNLLMAETVKIIPRHLVTYKLLGQPNGPHYGHYDLVGGRLVCFSF